MKLSQALSIIEMSDDLFLRLSDDISGFRPGKRVMILYDGSASRPDNQDQWDDENEIFGEDLFSDKWQVIRIKDGKWNPVEIVTTSKNESTWEHEVIDLSRANEDQENKP
jgi:hypothetical protein